ncbi:MAG: hypothetical protein PHY45_06515 [Rhodocyclaceae bacterium]|nr:hypothetical protein [Rhodocyclaceae bacterium]
MDIDFRWQRRSRKRFVGIAIFALAIALVVAQAWIFFALRAEADTCQSDRHRLDRLAATQRAQESLEARERLQAELRLANRIIDKLDTPWDALFGTIESAGGEQVILLGVDPDAEQRDVRLTGEAKDMSAVLGYLRDLRRAPALKSVYLTGHQINLQDPQRPVRFAIDAHWVEVPPAPKESQAAAAAKEAVGPPVATKPSDSPAMPGEEP